MKPKTFPFERTESGMILMAAFVAGLTKENIEYNVEFDNNYFLIVIIGY